MFYCYLGFCYYLPDSAMSDLFFVPYTGTEMKKIIDLKIAPLLRLNLKYISDVLQLWSPRQFCSFSDTCRFRIPPLPYQVFWTTFLFKLRSLNLESDQLLPTLSPLSLPSKPVLFPDFQQMFLCVSLFFCYHHRETAIVNHLDSPLCACVRSCVRACVCVWVGVRGCVLSLIHI